MKKILPVILCLLLLVSTLSSCKKQNRPSPAPSSSTDSSLPSSSVEAASGSNITPDGGEADEPLPAEMVITPVKGSPVSEINAKWAKQVELPEHGEVISFDNGDFMLISSPESEDHYDLIPIKFYRYDKQGKLLWQKTFDGITGWARVTLPLSDNCLLVLTTTDFKTKGDSIYVNGLLSKISPEGKIVWSKKLTHNYEYFSEVFEAPNGDLYTAGSYTCDYDAFEDDSAAEEQWFFPSLDHPSRPTLSRRDKNGNLLGYILPPYGVHDYGEDLGMYSVCDAQYRADIGLFVNFGNVVVRYDENLKEKWKYSLKKMAESEKQCETLGYFAPGHTSIKLYEDKIRVFCEAYSEGEQPYRVTELSFAGKLMSEKTISSEKEELVGFLPDGRQVFSENASGRIKTRLYFVGDGKKTEFDSFESDMTTWHLTPTVDGGFFILYLVSGVSDGGTMYYYVSTKYSAEGRTETQRVYGEGFSAYPLSCGRTAVINYRSAN